MTEWQKTRDAIMRVNGLQDTDAKKAIEQERASRGLKKKFKRFTVEDYKRITSKKEAA